MHLLLRLLPVLSCLSLSAFASNGLLPYLGHWALNIPGGQIGWLTLEQEGETLKGTLLWVSGSAEAVTKVSVEDGRPVVYQEKRWKQKGTDGKEGERFLIRQMKPRWENGEIVFDCLLKDNANPEGREVTVEAVNVPPPLKAPNLSEVRYGDPIELFNGRDLSGWQLVNPSDENGWSVKDGILVNRPVQEEGQSKKHYGNLRTEAKFEDFQLTLEVRPTQGSNSGVYLRGLYEVQVLDSHGKALDSHNMGAIYSRLTPKVAAEKPAGEWQTLDITLVQRHVTVVLNGVTIIDNEPVVGPTGGALSADVFHEGPLYLQGDHTQIEYRKLMLRPVLRKKAES